MMHRRGFSPLELDELEPELFQLLKVYDERIEPNGSKFQMMMFANLCHLMLISSGNLSERGQKEASVLDWDFLGLIQDLTTGEMYEKLNDKKNKEAQKQFNAIADSIKAIAQKDKKVMAKNKQQMIFEVTGDVTGLRKALSDGTQAIDKFGSESGELFGGLTESIGGLTSKFAGFSTGLVGTAGALGLVVGGVFSLVSASNEYVKTYNEVAASSSLSVTQLQKLEKQFGSTGLSVEKFGDLNRDVLDHLGDAFRDGSGPAGDMKAYGINLQNFNKYLNQSDGGIQAVAEAFYEMRKAGKSTAEITNMMETLGSDGSKLIGVFNQYGSALEFNNALQSQHAVLTEESARKYQEFDTKVTQLSTSFQLWKANALTPTVEEINTLLDLMNKDWSGTKFAEFFKDGVKGFFFNGDNAISKGLRNMFDEGATDYETEASKRIKDMAAQLQADIKDATKTTSKGGFVNKDKEEAARKAAAAKAAAEAKAQAQKVAQAQIQWDTATAQSGISTGEIRIKEFNRQQDALVKKIKTQVRSLVSHRPILTLLSVLQTQAANAS